MPATGEPGWPADAVEVASIVDAWGVKGWFKVAPFAADPQALFSSRRWFVKPPLQSGVQRPGAVSTNYPDVLRITDAKEHGGAVVAQAQGVDSRTDAEALRGARVFVGRSSFPTAGADEYYWVDLIGLQVFNREGLCLGKVIGLIDTGPQCALRVAPDGEEDAVSPASERLIPFVVAYVDAVSVERGHIVVDWGLDY